MYPPPHMTVWLYGQGVYIYLLYFFPLIHFTCFLFSLTFVYLLYHVLEELSGLGLGFRYLFRVEGLGLKVEGLGFTSLSLSTVKV